MVKRAPLLAACALLALALAGTASAASRTRPSDRACLLAWNAPGNHGSRTRLLAQRPIAGLALRAGVVLVDMWTKGSASTETRGPACLLTIEKRGSTRIVTGMWRRAGVGAWSFGRAIQMRARVVPNVRLLPDGRLTKIYLR
jgi:hypothetical protein